MAKAVAQASAFVGLTAAFWHISLAAGIVFLVMGFVAVGVHSSGYVQLEYDSRFRSRFRRVSDRGAAVRGDGVGATAAPKGDDSD